jgi:hypothetical protein
MIKTREIMNYVCSRKVLLNINLIRKNFLSPGAIVMQGLAFADCLTAFWSYGLEPLLRMCSSAFWCRIIMQLVNRNMKMLKITAIYDRTLPPINTSNK